MNAIIIDNVFDYGLSRSKKLIAELIKVVAKYANVKTDDPSIKIFEQDNYIEYDNLQILVTKFIIDQDYDFEEVPSAYIMECSINDVKYKCDFTSIDGEFAELLIMTICIRNC